MGILKITTLNVMKVLNEFRLIQRIPHCTILRLSSHYKHNYQPEVEAAINMQIQVEQQAAQEYLNMAVLFLHPCMSRPGAGGFFMKMYEEELTHMKDFIHYQLSRGGMPLIDGLVAPKVKLDLTLLEAFQKALELEKLNTKILEKLVEVAETANDYQCADYVTSVFLAEQMNSINEMAHHVTKLSRLSDEHEVYHYDLELSKSFPYNLKINSVK